MRLDHGARLVPRGQGVTHPGNEIPCWCCGHQGCVHQDEGRVARVEDQPLEDPVSVVHHRQGAAGCVTGSQRRTVHRRNPKCPGDGPGGVQSLASTDSDDHRTPIGLSDVTVDFGIGAFSAELTDGELDPGRAQAALPAGGQFFDRPPAGNDVGRALEPDLEHLIAEFVSGQRALDISRW